MADIAHTLITYVLPFLVVFTILVFVHELGHYWVARRAGVRVEVFSIGFGPELYGWHDRHGTRWKVSAVPLGGYVKMFGERDFDPSEGQPEITPEDRAVSFNHKTLRQRVAIVAAGPIANFLFAIVLLSGLFAIAGAAMPYAGIGSVQDDSAAATAGFEVGDRIVAIEGESVTYFDDLFRVVSANPGVEMVFEVERGGERLALVATPTPTERTDADGATRIVGLLGVSPDPNQLAYERMNPLEAIWTATDRTVSLVGQILTALWQIITGQRTAEELGGPLRIAQLSGEMAQSGVVSLILFMAALSINLGLINLFPVPMLDGGHLAFYAIEAVRGKPLDERVQEYGFRVGLVLVLLLMLFATKNDIVRFLSDSL